MLPDSFDTQMHALLGPDRWPMVRQALTESDSPVSLRLNTQKVGEDVVPLEAEGEVPWCRDGWYLSGRPAFTFDPLFHAGAYYVQEASSMFLDRVLRQYVNEPVRMLDLCAAPGGKSTVARAALPEGSLLVSNEPMRTRAQILVENMLKWGHEDVIVTNNLPRDFRRAGLGFDVILTDVPCSGEGMFRKDEGAIREWSLQNVEQCWRLQREIVDEAWQCLRPGGLLIYSTCTFNVKEDEENVRWICEKGAEPLSVQVEPSWQITGSLLSGFDAPVYRFLPGVTRGEGLFMAVLRKPVGTSCQNNKERGTNNKGQRRNDKGLSSVAQNPLSISHTVPRVLGSKILAIPDCWADVFDAMVRSLNVIHAGVFIGETKGRDLIPSASLALVRCLRRDAYAQCELNYTQVVAYLRRETITLPADMPRGFVLVTYRGLPLGFVKNLGSRANNLFPTEWRIRSTHAPTEAPSVLPELVR